MNDKAIEQEIQSKGLTAPRITPADIEANISVEYFFTAADGVDGADLEGLRRKNPKKSYTFIPYEEDVKQKESLSLLTFCVLVLRNGFTVTGESACASPENFDAEIGRKIARQNAINKVWPLMGYKLKEDMMQQERLLAACRNSAGLPCRGEKEGCKA